jgi:hypothetical protein
MSASTLLVRAFRIASPFKYLSRKRDEDVARGDDADQITQDVNNEFRLENERNHANDSVQQHDVEVLELSRIPTMPSRGEHSNAASNQSINSDGSSKLDYSVNESVTEATTAPISSSATILQASVDEPQLSKWQSIKIYVWTRLRVAHIVYATMLIVSLLIYLPTPTSSPVYLPILLPLYLSMSVLAYYVALQVPDRIRFFLHPIISSSAIVWVGMEITEAIKGGNLFTGLAKFSTGTRYLAILEGKSGGTIPGAGDVLFSLLDCSIISLSTVMFRYRQELKKHAFEMLLTIIALSTASLFCLPLFAHAVGVPPSKALSLAPRYVRKGLYYHRIMIFVFNNVLL